MNKKNNAKKVAALVLGLALAAGGVGCGNFIITDSEKDLKQTVATVNVSGHLTEEYADVADDVAEIVNSLSTDISKRDLVISFLNTGYQYVQNYGYTTEDTFNMLMDGLVSNEIMIQYAIAYYLKNTSLSAAGCKQYVEAQKAGASEREKELYKAYPEVLVLKYFITDGGNDDTDYNVVVYNLKKSLNDSLDSLEEGYIKAETNEEETTEARTLPTNVKTEKEDYFNANYGVYTGRNTKDGKGGFGDYEKQEGSTTSTRKKAYNAFLANLQTYNLIGNEDTTDVTELSYYYVELSSLLGQALINKYFESMEDSVTANMNETYMQAKYKEMRDEQKNAYETEPSDFSTAMGSVSDTSFLLYGLDGFGYVYNILLPFSTSQNIRYSEAKNNGANSQNDIYKARREILKGVKGKDLRDSWISLHDASNYSYTVGEGAAKKYYFFEDNLGANAQYEKLTQYAGTYAYNGKVEEVDDELEFTPEEIAIDKAHDGNDKDGFIEIFQKHITETVNETGIEAKGQVNVGNTAKFSKPAEKYTSYNTSKFTNDKDEVKDYSSFIYYTGKVEGLTASADDYFKEGTAAYKALSAVNELMFAYSTDTGCLNTYFGYAVSPYKTDFVKEFEYAAREAIKGGVGTYVVCATDFGWHIVYASYVYNGTGDVYGGYNEAQKDTEGSFSNLFYESLKTSAAQNYSTEKQNEVLNRYNNDDCVTLFTERYQDLLDLE